MNAMSAGLRSLGLILLAAALACNGGGGASSDVPGGADGSDLPDVPPLGALVVDRGDLDADAAQWNALGRRWTRATSAAVQAVVATNSVLYRDLGTLGMSPFQDALKAANGAAAVLATTAAELSTDARALLAGASSGLASPGGDAPLALTSRQARQAQDLADLADVLVAEAARLQAALAPFPVADGTDGRDPVLVAAALATLRAATPVALLAGAVPVAPGRASGAPAPAGGAAGLLDVTSASLAAARIQGTFWLPGVADDDGSAGTVPFAGTPASAFILRGDDHGPDPADRLVGVVAPEAPSLTGDAVALTFADAASADATVAPMAAGRACWIPGNVASDADCSSSAAGLLTTGNYKDPDTGALFQSAGVSASAARLIRAGLSGGDVVISLPADPSPPPAPLIAGIAPAEGPFGTSITLTGSGFGIDPSRVGITMSHGRLLHPAPTSVSDTTITFVAPDGVVPPYDYPLCMFRGYQDGDVWVTIDGMDSTGAYYRYTALPPCQPVPVQAPSPAIASPGDELMLYGIGFASDPAQNLVDFGGTQFPATGYTVDALLAFDGMGTITFNVPAGAGAGVVTVRVKRLDGVGPWVEASPMEVRPATIPTVDAGEETDGLFLPVAAWDVGAASEGALSYPTSWVLGGSHLAQLRRENLDDHHLTVGVTTKRGSATFPAAVLSDDRMVVSVDPQATTIFNGLGADDSVSLTVFGLELFNLKTRTSAPASVPVRGNLEVGRVVTVGSRFHQFASWQKPVKVARGDTLYLQPDDPYDVVVAPGIFDGSLVFNRTGDPEPAYAVRDQVMGRAFALGTLGVFTLTNTATGDTLPLSVEEEGAEGMSAYPAVDGPAKRLGVDGARFGCGGVRVTIPPGALPDPDGTGGAYAITCSHSAVQNALGLPQLTAGSFVTRLTFDPEPARLLAPITLEMPFTMEGRTTPPEIGLMDAATGLYANLPTEVDMGLHVARLVVPAGEYKPAAATPGLAHRDPLPRFVAPAFPAAAPSPASPSSGLAPAPLAAPAPAPLAAPAPVGFPSLSLNQITGSVAVFSWKSEKGTLTDEDRKIQVNYVSDPAAAGYVSDAFAAEVMATLIAVYDKLTGQGWAQPAGCLGGWIVVTVADMGDAAGVKGSTTAGVFGQPWVKINSRLPMGKVLKTTTAHEMGHVFQRQYTTNLVMNWIDEASANWVAVETLGAEADIAGDIVGGLDFPTLSLPGTFNTGYDADQAYAAGAWAVWLNGNYAGAILGLYEALYGNPVYWSSAWLALGSVTGTSVAELTTGFATAYWTQALDVTQGISLTHSTRALDGDVGVDVSDARPAASSNRIDVRVSADVVTKLAGRDLVARGSGLLAGQSVDVYADTVGCDGPASAGMPRVATLLQNQPDALIGAVGFGCLRVVLTNFSESSAATLGVRLVAPKIDALAPPTGSNKGGYTLTVTGTGFGSQPGQLTISGFTLTPLTWSDTSITATMINAGSATGPWDVKAVTRESARSNAAAFTFVN